MKVDFINKFWEIVLVLSSLPSLGDNWVSVPSSAASSRKQVLQEKTLANFVTAGILPWITMAEIEIGRRRQFLPEVSHLNCGGGSGGGSSGQENFLLNIRGNQPPGDKLISNIFSMSAKTYVLSSKSRRNLCWKAFISSEVCRKCFCWCWNYQRIIKNPFQPSAMIWKHSREMRRNCIAFFEFIWKF